MPEREGAGSGGDAVPGVTAAPGLAGLPLISTPPFTSTTPRGLAAMASRNSRGTAAPRSSARFSH